MSYYKMREIITVVINQTVKFLIISEKGTRNYFNSMEEAKKYIDKKYNKSKSM